jgi:hypothetical protein
VSSAFADAVLATACLAEALRDGLQAVRRTDRHRITCREGRLLTGSVDVDQATLTFHPQDNRWDYSIGIKNDDERVVWVEIHPASSQHVQEVIDKLHWLRRWLKSEAPLLRQFPPRFVWVASGKVALTPNSPQRRRVAQEGLYFAGERVQVDRI